MKLKKECEKMDPFSRTKMLFLDEAFLKLENSHVAIFGLGGVGSYVLEALSRAGVKTFTLVDNDIIDITNINRQIMALHSTVGYYKVDVAKERVININPKASVTAVKAFFNKETKMDFLQFDYVVDAIDTVGSKLTLIEECNKHNIQIISAMGTANKLDPTQLKISDIYKTSICPLCKVMRRELKRRNIHKLKVVYSNEMPIKVLKDSICFEPNTSKILGSMVCVPASAGLIIASEVIKDLSSL